MSHLWAWWGNLPRERLHASPQQTGSLLVPVMEPQDEGTWASESSWRASRSMILDFT